jgi:phospholipid transport system substrate-binding protein
MSLARHLVVALLFWTALVPTARAGSDPGAMIETLHQTLLATMQQAKALNVDGRYAKLEPVLKDTYDFERMIAIASGSHWASATAEEKAAMTKAFSRFSIATYATRFNTYDGEKFEILGKRDGPRGTVLIDTRIVKGNGEAVPITYVFFQKDGDWRVTDVLLEQSISELAVRRSEYARTLNEGGPGKLAEVLNSKVDAMLATKS